MLTALGLCPSKATSYLVWNLASPASLKCWKALRAEAFNASQRTHVQDFLVFEYYICSECLLGTPKSPPASCPLHLRSLDDTCSCWVLCIHFLKRQKNVFIASQVWKQGGSLFLGDQMFLGRGFCNHSDGRPLTCGSTLCRGVGTCMRYPGPWLRAKTWKIWEVKQQNRTVGTVFMCVWCIHKIKTSG